MEKKEIRTCEILFYGAIGFVSLLLGACVEMARRLRPWGRSSKK